MSKFTKQMVQGTVINQKGETVMSKFTKQMVPGTVVMVAVGLLALASMPSASAIVVETDDMTRTGLADPGGIVGDGIGANVAPFFIHYPTFYTRLGYEPLDGVQNARGGVQFTLEQPLVDGDWSISSYIRPNNFLYYPSFPTVRNHQFAMRLTTSGSATINGGTDTGWFKVQPNYDDSGDPPFKTVYLSGQANSDFVFAAYDTVPQVQLLGVDGITSKLSIWALDGTGANYGYLDVDFFTLNGPVPEPSTVALAAAGCVMLAMRRRCK